MPFAPKRACSEPGCLETASRIGRCEAHARIVEREREVARQSNAGRSWYASTRWRALRVAVLRREPLCKSCLADGRSTAATEVDHIIAHQGAPRLFWDRANLQPLCAPCHWAKTRRERIERAGERAVAEGREALSLGKKLSKPSPALPAREADLSQEAPAPVGGSLGKAIGVDRGGRQRDALARSAAGGGFVVVWSGAKEARGDCPGLSSTHLEHLGCSLPDGLGARWARRETETEILGDAAVVGKIVAVSLVANDIPKKERRRPAPILFGARLRERS